MFNVSGDYIRNQCQRSHCIPCYIRYPSCKDLSNGIHANENKLWSPFHITCYNQRLVSEARCPVDSEGRTQLFHPGLNECVSLDLIPQEHGGMMPNCTGKGDGEHLDDFGRCDRYHICLSGRFVNTVKCNPGENFDALYGICTPVDKACGPCGNRLDWYVFQLLVYIIHHHSIVLLILLRWLV